MNRQVDSDCLAEMGAAIERLREEIRELKEQRDALEEGNLALYRELTEPTEPDF